MIRQRDIKPVKAWSGQYGTTGKLRGFAEPQKLLKTDIPVRIVPEALWREMQRKLKEAQP